MKKRILSFLLAFVMVLGMLPAMAPAANAAVTPAFIKAPVGGGVASGQTLIVTWELNFTPVKLMLFKFSGNSFTTDHLNVSANYAELGAGYDYFRLRAYYDDSNYVQSEKFYVTEVTPAFTTQPVGGGAYSGETLTVSWDLNFVPVNQNLVCYDNNGAAVSTQMLGGDVRSAQVEPSRYGMRIEAYYAPGQCIISDLFYVSETTRYFRVNFFVDNVQISTLTPAAGEKIARPADPVKDDYTFLWWLTDEGAVYDFNQPVTSNINLYAWFGHTVTFHMGGDRTLPLETTHGEPIQPPADPTLEGADFMGWFTADGELYDLDQPVTKNFDLYAKFSHTVQFYIGDMPTSYQNVERGQTAREPYAQEIEGLTFLGWYTEDGERYDFSTPVTENLNIYAKYGYVVNFWLETDDLVTFETVEPGECVEEPYPPEKGDMSFMGWYTADGELYDFSAPVSGDIHLYAKFGYVLTYCFDEYPVGWQTVEPGKAAKEPEPPGREGMSFMGWYTADGELYDFSAPVTQDVYIYAKFGYVLTYCFGEYPVGWQTVEPGQCGEAPEDPAQEGKVFLGWYTDLTGGELYDFSTPVTGNIYLYARFADAAPQNPFTDVPEDSFYYEPVMWAVANGITTGATETTFNPNGTCFRAHVVTFLHRAAGSPRPNSRISPFVDVTPNDFFFLPVLWAVDNSITNGVSENEFGAYSNCNRAAVVTFLWRAAGCPMPTSANNPFVDVQPTDFYYNAVLWAVENGITNGVDATHFGPNQSCNRAQVVTFLYRANN